MQKWEYLKVFIKLSSWTTAEFSDPLSKASTLTFTLIVECLGHKPFGSTCSDKEMKVYVTEFSVVNDQFKDLVGELGQHGWELIAVSQQSPHWYKEVAKAVEPYFGSPDYLREVYYFKRISNE